MNTEMIRRRSELYGEIRSFFTGLDYLEVETPILSQTLIPEPTIENFSTTYSSEFHPGGERYLIPSPEIHMKQLLAEGSGNIFQIIKCFRNREQIGRLHNPEFSMLEWYTVEADSADSIETLRQLLEAVVPPEAPDHIRGPIRTMSVAEACWKYARFDLEKVQSRQSILKLSASLGLSPSTEPALWADEFNRVFLTFVEPELPQDRPLVLYDYPQQISCLAKEKPGTPYRERWELYAGGMELANCYTEETSGEKVAAYMRREYSRLVQERSRTGTVIPDIDPAFAQLFDGRFPPCSGTALGLDRLLMVLYNMKTIEGVMLFPFSDRI